MPAQGDPAEWPLWTRRTGVSLYLPCPEMYVPRAGEVGLGQNYLPRPVGLLWLMPSRDRSGPSWLNASTWSERPKLFGGSLEPVGCLGAHTAYTH